MFAVIMMKSSMLSVHTSCRHRLHRAGFCYFVTHQCYNLKLLIAARRFRLWIHHYTAPKGQFSYKCSRRSLISFNSAKYPTRAPTLSLPLPLLNLKQMIMTLYRGQHNLPSEVRGPMYMCIQAHCTRLTQSFHPSPIPNEMDFVCC